jgi:hypothetical protein
VTDKEEVGRSLGIKYPSREKIIDKLFPKEGEDENS